jgi:hypothetical protein
MVPNAEFMQAAWHQRVRRKPAAAYRMTEARDNREDQVSALRARDARPKWLLTTDQFRR